MVFWDRMIECDRVWCNRRSCLSTACFTVLESYWRWASLRFDLYVKARQSQEIWLQLPCMVSIRQVPSFRTKFTLEHDFELVSCFDCYLSMSRSTLQWRSNTNSSISSCRNLLVLQLGRLLLVTMSRIWSHSEAKSRQTWASGTIWNPKGVPCQKHGTIGELQNPDHASLHCALDHI